MVMNKKQKHIKKSRSYKQHGGFASTTRPHITHKPNTTMPHTNMPLQKGGSPASTLVMQDTVNPPVTNDFVTSNRIRDSWFDNSLSSLEPSCMQKGGSPASELVMDQLNSNADTKPYPNGWKVKGDMNSLNLYQTTGGSRKKHSRKSKRNNKRNSMTKKNKNHSRKNKKSKNNSNRRSIQRGGASDWIMSQYSLGPNNNPEQSASWVSNFSQSGAASRADYMNPSTLGLAGSGYPMGSLEGSNVRHVGAPLS
jgi:hypothetical protein